MEFNIGDIVICKKVFMGKDSALNKIGKIIDMTEVYYTVEFLKYIRGHSGRECRGKLGHCWDFSWSCNCCKKIDEGINVI